MPEITDSLDDAIAKLVSEIKTVAEANALRQMLLPLRIAIAFAKHEAGEGALKRAEKIVRDMDREEAVFHGECDA